MLAAVGRSPCVVNTSVSSASEALPAAASAAPPVADEFSQPRPGPAGGFEHGHTITPAEPGSQKLWKFGGPSQLATLRYEVPAMSARLNPAVSVGPSNSLCELPPHSTSSPSLRSAMEWYPHAVTDVYVR